MSVETAVAIGALICVTPVVFGLIVAKWDRRWSRAWSRADRAGKLR